MKHLITIVLLLFASPTWAAPIDDAAAANARGDYAAELRITRPLATKGVAWAQMFLAGSYKEGNGVPRNYAEAANWYRLAATQGNDLAQLQLGVMYGNGKGVVQNYAEAVKWFRLASVQGHALAQHNLGLSYDFGRGVVQDYVLAHMWLNIAAVKGDAEAVKNRDIAASKMTQQQMAEAQKLARECQARDFKGC
jgi:TPR repeat protein